MSPYRLFVVLALTICPAVAPWDNEIHTAAREGNLAVLAFLGERVYQSH